MTGGPDGATAGLGPRGQAVARLVREQQLQEQLTDQGGGELTADEQRELDLIADARRLVERMEQNRGVLDADALVSAARLSEAAERRASKLSARLADADRRARAAEAQRKAVDEVARATTAEQRARQAFLRADAAVLVWPTLHRRLMVRRAAVALVTAVVLTIMVLAIIGVPWAMLIVASVGFVMWTICRQPGYQRRARAARREAERKAAPHRSLPGSRADLAQRYAVRAEAGELHEQALVALLQAGRAAGSPEWQE